MNMPHKFVSDLSDEDRQQLLENYQTHQNFRVRTRSHAILLSFEKHSVDQIAVVCRVHRTTVGQWIDNWNQSRKLADGERAGRPPILSLEEQARAVEIGLQNPRFPHRELAAIKEETGKEISSFTLKRLIKKRFYLEKNQTRIVAASR